MNNKRIINNYEIIRKINRSRIKKEIIKYLGIKGKAYVSEIARQINTSSRNISSYLDEFKELGLIEELDSENKRIRTICLTPKARELFEYIYISRKTSDFFYFIDLRNKIYKIKGILTVISNLHLPYEILEGNKIKTYNFIPGIILINLIKQISYSLADYYGLSSCINEAYLSYSYHPCKKCDLCKFFGEEKSYLMRNPPGISITDCIPLNENIDLIQYRKNLAYNSLVQEEFIRNGSTFDFEMTILKNDKRILKLIFNSLKFFEISGIETISLNSYGRFKIDFKELYEYQSNNLYKPKKINIKGFLDDILY